MLYRSVCAKASQGQSIQGSVSPQQSQGSVSVAQMWRLRPQRERAIAGTWALRASAHEPGEAEWVEGWGMVGGEGETEAHSPGPQPP